MIIGVVFIVIGIGVLLLASEKKKLLGILSVILGVLILINGVIAQ